MSSELNDGNDGLDEMRRLYGDGPIDAAAPSGDPVYQEEILPKEYGFWANVNPDVSHPRWSQKTEWKIGGGKYDRVPTMLFNGYGEYVSYLYTNLKDDSLYR